MRIARSIPMIRTLTLPLALLLAGCVSAQPIEPQLAAASTDFSNAQRVEVALDSFDFAPRELQLSAGQPIELVLTNVSDSGHNFAATEFFAAALIRPADAELVRNGLLELRGGASVSVFLVPVAGSYDIDCTHLGHTTLGMTGTIIVS